MSANPSALVRLFAEFKNAAPEKDDIVLGGMYAAKSGYHNSRANHLANKNGGDRGDYSIELPIDRVGPSDKAAALDITFDSARASRFGTIAKYSKRLLAAMKGNDPRLFYRGDPVVREFFGNTDLDREVEGWSLYRNRAVTSDSSHLWHIHLSFHRKHVENWDAVKGVLDVLLGKPIVPPKVDNDMTQTEFITFFRAAMQDTVIRQEMREIAVEAVWDEIQPANGTGQAVKARFWPPGSGSKLDALAALLKKVADAVGVTSSTVADIDKTVDEIAAELAADGEENPA